MNVETKRSEKLGIAAGVASDAELISAARGGDVAAFSELYARHTQAAQAVARQHAPRPADCEDIVSEAFARIFRLLQEGKGPDSFFRAYLFTSVRRLCVDWFRAAGRTQTMDDGGDLAETLVDPVGVQPDDLADQAMVRAAFGSLPERWRSVLWYAEVEGLTPAQIAPVLGLSANGTAALLHRAREGLRQAFLQQHLAKPLDAACRSVSVHLGAWARGALSSRERGRVDEHLVHCVSCRKAAEGVRDVNASLRAAIAPAVLGAGAVALLDALKQTPPLATMPGAEVSGAASSTAPAETAPTPAETATTPAETATTPSDPGAATTPSQAGLTDPSTTITPGDVTSTLHASSPAAQQSAGLLARLGPLKATIGLAVTGALVVGGAFVANRSDGPPPPQPMPPASSAPVTSEVPTVEPAPSPAVTTLALNLQEVFLGTGRLGAVEVGAPLTPCSPHGPCESSSTTVLVLPEGSQVKYAMLQWATAQPLDGWLAPTLRGPQGRDHAITPTSDPLDLLADGQLAMADITPLVAADGPGPWTFIQPAAATGYAGWALVVAYENPAVTQDQRVAIYAGAGLVEAGQMRDLNIDLPTNIAGRLGFVSWGARPGRPGTGIWMWDVGSPGGMAQPLPMDGFLGKAAGFEGDSPGADVFAFAGPIIFPQNQQGTRAIEALSFRASQAGDQEASPFAVGAVSVVAPVQIPTSSPASVQ